MKKGPLSWLQQLLNKDNKDQKDKKPSIYVYVFIVVILGIGLMMASSFFTSNQTGQTSNSQAVFNNKTKKIKIQKHLDKRKAKNSKQLEIMKYIYKMR